MIVNLFKARLLIGNAGTFNPSTGHFISEAEKGNTLYLNRSAEAFQTSSFIVESNSDYLLTFDVGNRLDSTFLEYEVRIRVGNTYIHTATTPFVPESGQFVSAELFVQTGSNIVSGPITLELVASSEVNGQVNFDNFAFHALEVMEEQPSNNVVGFGDWQHNMLGTGIFNLDTAYTAENDGFINLHASGDCGNHMLDIQVLHQGEWISISRTFGYQSAMSPVKKGMQWRIYRRRYPNAGCNIGIGYIPLVTN